jgi:hypothetical protein
MPVGCLCSSGTVLGSDDVLVEEADGADESFCDRVCRRGPDRRVDHADALSVEDRVEGVRELAIVVRAFSRSP